MIHRYALLSLLMIYNLSLQAMANDDHAKELAYNQLAPKIAIMHYCNKTLEQRFKKDLVKKNSHCSTVIRLAQFYNKAATANEAECKFFNSDELDVLFNDAKMWDLDDQSGDIYVGRSYKFVEKLILNPEKLKQFSVCIYTQTEPDYLTKMSNKTYNLIQKISDNNPLKNQLLQEVETILHEYKSQMALRELE